MIPKIITPHYHRDEPVASLYEGPDSLVKTAFSTNEELRSFMQNFTAKKDHGYPLISALGSYETFGPNNNMDQFRKSQLIPHEPNPKRPSGFKTFLDAKVYRHHNNKPSSPSFGNVVSAFWNPKMGRVELLLELPVQQNAKELADIEANRDVAFSMGCRVSADKCTICGNVAPTRRNYCDHLKYQLGHVNDQGVITAMDNLDPQFFDISLVTTPADKIAYALKYVKPEDYQLQKAASEQTPIEINSDEFRCKIAYQATVLDYHPDSIYLLQKYASLPESVKMAAISESPIKLSSRKKTADIDKLVPMEAVKDDDHGLHELYSKFRNEGMSHLRAHEPEMTSEHIDELADASGDTKGLLSTLAAHGVILKPVEYQRLMLGAMDKKPERAAFDESHHTILDAHPSLHPDDAKSNCMDHRCISHANAEALEDLIAAKSYHRGALLERVRDQLKEHEAHETPEDEANESPEWQAMEDAMGTEEHEDSPLLDRLGGAYEDYAKKAMLFARQTAQAHDVVFGDTKLASRLGLHDGLKGLPMIAFGAPIKEAADAMQREYGILTQDRLKTAAAALGDTNLPIPVIDGLVMDKLAFNARQAKIIARIAEGFAPEAGQGARFSRGVAHGVSGEMAATAKMTNVEAQRLMSKLDTMVPGKKPKALGQLRDQLSNRIMPIVGAQKPTVRVDPGAFESHIRSETKDYIKSTGAPASAGLKPLEPRQSKMLHNIAQGHELDEIDFMKNSPSLVTQRMGHASPGVIYREHNRVVTLPKKGYKDTQLYLKTLRNINPENAKLFERIDPRLNYGEGQRLSRHAIKRLSGIADEKMIEDWSKPGFSKAKYDAYDY